MATDSFTGVTGTAIATYDANWSVNAGDFSIQSNELAAAGAAGTTECAARYAGTYPDDQFAEATFTASAAVANARIGVGVRIATDGSANYYGLYYDADASETIMFKVVGGVFTQLGVSFGALSVGNVIRLDVTGTTLTFLKGGVSQGTRTDSDLASGSPGVVGKGATTGHRIDDWSSTDAVASAPIEQEGFRFRNDDGSESAATWLAAQDTNVTQPSDTNTRLRVLLNATGDPDSQQFQLEYKLSTDSSYTALGTVASGKVTPVIDSGDATNSGNNTASASWSVTTPAASTGDLICLIIGWDDSTTTTGASIANGPNGEVWTQINSVVISASTSDRMTAFYVKATGSWSAGTITVTPTASEQWTATVLKIPAGEFDSTTPIGASNTRASAGTAETAALSPSLTAGASDGGGRLVWAATVDADPLVTLQAGNTQVAMVDRGAVSLGVAVRDTAVTNSEAIAGGDTWGGISAAWCSLTFVVRAPTVNHAVYIATSANITASGENTTAQLTAPSGKTTSDFVAGRIQDDENPADAIDITTDDYTELEWCLQANSAAASNGNVYQFKVTNSGTDLDTYTVTPQWTIGTAGGGGSVQPPRSMHQFRQRAA